MTAQDGHPEEFRASWSQTWHGTMRPFVGVNILIALLTWVIGYALGGPVTSVVVPVVVVGAITALGRYASASQGLRLSPEGVEFLQRGGGIVRMRWGDIERTAVLTPKRGPVAGTTGVAYGAASAGAGAFVAANTGPGLVGQGEVLSAAEAARQRGAPAWLPAAEGRRPVLMQLMLVDRDWQRSGVGAWVRRYRPDLLPPVQSTAPRL